MSVRVSCPFCNTAFALPGVPPTGRAVCPRCGELVPVRVRAEEDDEPATASTPEPAISPAAAPPGSPARRNELLATLAVILGLLGLGVGLLLYYRGHKNSPQPETPASAAAAPAELAGLGYLPADCNVVFAVAPGPLLAHADRAGQDPRELLTKAGVPGSVFTTLDRLGLDLRQIDHVAGGTLIADDTQELRLALVLVLRQRLADEEKFLHGLEAKKTPGPKARYNVTFAGLPMLLARVSETVWVFGLDEKDLEPAERGAGKASLSPGLREMLAERLPADTAAWAAADSGRWASKPLVKLAVGQALKHPEWLPVIAKGQAAVAGWSFGDPPRLRVAVRCVDADTGEKLRAYFRSKAGDKGEAGGSGDWATLDTPADPQSGFATLKDFLDDAGK